MPVTSRNGRCGSQGENNAGHSHVPEGQNLTDHKVHSLEHQALSLPLPHLKDENIFGIREGKLGPKPRPLPKTQLQQTQPQPSTSTCPQNANPMTRKAPGQVTRGEEPYLTKEGLR